VALLLKGGRQKWGSTKINKQGCQTFEIGIRGPLCNA